MVDVTEKVRSSLVHSVTRTQFPPGFAALPRRSDHPPARRSRAQRPFLPPLVVLRRFVFLDLSFLEGASLPRCRRPQEVEQGNLSEPWIRLVLLESFLEILRASHVTHFRPFVEAIHTWRLRRVFDVALREPSLVYWSRHGRTPLHQGTFRRRRDGNCSHYLNRIYLLLICMSRYRLEFYIHY